jgi:hypothetical protein
VIAVGGTELTLTEAGARASETVWNEGVSEEKDVTGGGCSTQFSAPPWQVAVPDWAAVGCGTGAQAKRAVADVAADGAPYTGAAIYDSVPYYIEPGLAIAPGWVTVGGTSLSSPIVASLFALVGGAQGVEYPAATLYSHLGGASLYDVTSGGDGKCDGVYTGGCEGSMSPLSPLDCGEGVLICNAGPGYDGPSGVGAPSGLAAFEVGSEAGHAERVAAREAAAKKAEEEQKAAEKKAEEKRRAEEEKRAEERRPEEERRQAERRAEEERKDAEAQRAAELKAEEELKASEAYAEAQRAKAKAEEEQKAEEAAAAAKQKAELEQQMKSLEEGWLSTAGTANGNKGSTSSRTVHLSGLALTASAKAAIAHSQLTLSQVTFTFDLSGSARVRITLSRLLATRGRRHWAAATGALALDAAQGHNRAHLSGRTALAPGTYRLTLTPASGAGRSIVFAVRTTTNTSR